MIRLASSTDELAIRHIWKVCFGDTDEYIDLVFRNKYRPSNTLVYVDGNRAVAALQMLPYRMRFYGAIVDFYYLAGLSTLPQYQGKGYMGRLIQKSHDVMMQRHIPLSILVPAGSDLFSYYQKFGYKQISQRSKEPIDSLKDILNISPDLKITYPIFLDTFCNGNLHVLKTFDDYALIVEEYVNSGYENKYNLGAMAHIVDNDALQMHLGKEESQKQEDAIVSFQHTTINFMLE